MEKKKRREEYIKEESRQREELKGRGAEYDHSTCEEMQESLTNVWCVTGNLKVVNIELKSIDKFQLSLLILARSLFPMTLDIILLMFFF